jgi:GNAT superfamily N-acetyltransferase
MMLRDGSQVLIRQVQPADAALLAEGFARLSARSRWMRYLAPKRELSPTELHYLTQIDHHHHEAIGAVDRADGRGVGVARFVKDATDPQTADLAVTVIDAWQGRGLGTKLLIRLYDGARQGVSAGSPRWLWRTTGRWPACYGAWSLASCANTAPWSTR